MVAEKLPVAAVDRDVVHVNAEAVEGILVVRGLDLEINLFLGGGSRNLPHDLKLREMKVGLKHVLSDSHAFETLLSEFLGNGDSLGRCPKAIQNNVRAVEPQVELLEGK